MVIISSHTPSEGTGYLFPCHSLRVAFKAGSAFLGLFLKVASYYPFQDLNPGNGQRSLKKQSGKSRGRCAEGIHPLPGLTVLQRAFRRPPRPRLRKQPDQLCHCPLPCPQHKADEKTELSKCAVSKWFNGSIQSPGSGKNTALLGHHALWGDLVPLCGRSPWASPKTTFQNWGPGTPTNITARAHANKLFGSPG